MLTLPGPPFVRGVGPGDEAIEGLAQVISMHEMPTNQIASSWIQLHADTAVESRCKPHVVIAL